MGPQLNTLQSWEGFFPATPKGVSGRKREQKPTEHRGLPWWLKWERICLKRMRPGFDPGVAKIPCRRKRQSAPVLLPGKCRGQRSLAGFIPWGHRWSDTTERAHTHTQHRCEVLKAKSEQDKMSSGSQSTAIKHQQSADSPPGKTLEKQLALHSPAYIFF